MKNINILADKLDFTQNKEDYVNEVKSLIATLLNYWYLFLIGIVLCMGITFFIIRLHPPQFKIYSKIIVEDDKNSAAKTLTNGMNSDLSSLFDIKSNAYNEVKVLESKSLLKRVISKLKLNVHVFEKNRLGTTELFNNLPFHFVTIINPDSSRSATFNILVKDADKFEITNVKTLADTTAVFDKPLMWNGLNFVLKKVNTSPGKGYKVVLSSVKQSENELSSKFSAALDDKQSTVIDLQLSYGDPARGERILETFMQLYLQNNLADKIRIADSTMKFIDNRLTVVGLELNRVEKSLQEFKINNKISDISAQSKVLVESAEDYQKKLNDNEVQLAIANDLKKYVIDGNNTKVVPSSLITKDMSFGTAINAYNEMLLRREALQLNLVDESAPVKNLDQQISMARQALLASLENYRNSLQVSESALKKQNSTLNNTIANTPVKQRVYLDYTRQQTLKQDLYLFLLQKREETAISQTATLSNCHILDNAEGDESPFAPNKSLLYSIGLFAGIVLPAAGLGIKGVLSNRINTKSDINSHTDIPLLGEISKNRKGNKLLKEIDPRSLIAEEIRAIRTNLKYVTDNGKSNVILFTSSMSGEGKSFLSLNLGHTIALSGKKVVLLELDLRKPKLLSYIDASSNYGFTDYMIADDKTNLKELIKPLEFNKNLFLISSGHMPPNPAELLMSEKLKFLIADLRKTFDYVLIDSPPVGQVSDALIIEEYADITCYVIRQNYTYKSQLGIANDLKKSGKVKQLYLIVNDIEVKKNSITGYGYSRGYGSYSYIKEENTNNKLRGVFKKLMSNLT